MEAAAAAESASARTASTAKDRIFRSHCGHVQAYQTTSCGAAWHGPCASVGGWRALMAFACACPRTGRPLPPPKEPLAPRGYLVSTHLATLQRRASPARVTGPAK